MAVGPGRNIAGVVVTPPDRFVAPGIRSVGVDLERDESVFELRFAISQRGLAPDELALVIVDKAIHAAHHGRVVGRELA